MDVRVEIDSVKGDPHVYSELLVVDEVEDPRFEIRIDQARKIDPNIQLLDKIMVETTPRDFGRIAAQTAKQVILQGIRDVERDNVYVEFNERRGELMIGQVQRNVNGNIIIDLGKAEAILPKDQQVASDNYRPGTRLKVILKDIRREDRGTRLVVSRTEVDLIRRIFEMEVPEILAGTVEIKSISREPGIRTKCAVAARQEGIDPVGACVGIRGVRIENIVNELNGEKIDVVQWSPDIKEFIANALSPAQVVEVRILELEKAVVIVPDKQLSLAIGKEGQNVRLAAKLTKWKIDIKSSRYADGRSTRSERCPPRCRHRKYAPRYCPRECQSRRPLGVSQSDDRLSRCRVCAGRTKNISDKCSKSAPLPTSCFCMPMTA
jgi:N utilization substance protein A